MNILGFDTSSKDIYLALITDVKKVSKVIKDTPSTEQLLVKIDEFLNEYKLKISDINIISSGIGPGSFTGSRVAIVTAKAFAVANVNMKLLPFSAFDAIGYKDDGNLYVLEGFSNFVYTAKNGEFLCETIDSAKKKANESECVFATCNILGVPNFKKVEYDILKAILGKLGTRDYTKVSELEPIYLRASQAEIQLEEKLKRGNK